MRTTLSPAPPPPLALLEPSTLAFAALPALAPAGGDMLTLVLSIVLLIVCLGVHEAAHAFVAWRCGDSTARDLGRLTLNPIAHIDPWMTILLPGMLFYLTGGRMIFGGARPVPVDFHRLRHPWRDMSLVALAGPGSNLVMAVLFAIAWNLAVNHGLYNGAAETAYLRQFDRLPTILQMAVGFNLLLAVFNMVPIPPLDGSRVMAWLLPASMRPAYLAIERFGIAIVFALFFFVPGLSALVLRSITQIQALLIEPVRLTGMR